jgi:DNA-binding MurR/RpiR family transcriptional regulator
VLAEEEGHAFAELLASCSILSQAEDLFFVIFGLQSSVVRYIYFQLRRAQSNVQQICRDPVKRSIDMC